MSASARCGVERRQKLPADVTPDSSGGVETQGERRVVRPRRWVCADCGNQLTLSDRFCGMCGRATE